jgi:hypothetical protein
MPDFRIADTAAEHPKLRAAGLPAAGLWSLAGAWCMNPAHLTDGWIPLHYVQSWPGGRKLAAVLVEVGLWSPENRGKLTGWRFHDWADIQRSAASIEDDKRKARDRMKRVRSGNVRANAERTSEGTQPERAANVHDSLTLTHTLTPSRDLGGEVAKAPQAPARPQPRCPQHANHDNPPPCGACAEARRAAEDFDRGQALAATDRRTHEARQRDEDRRRAIDNCGLCDPEGYAGRQICTHDPDAAERAARGRAAVHAAMHGNREGP